MDLAGEITQDHVQPWSTVMHVPTDHGSLYFKANHDDLRHEAAVVGLLSARRPDFVPPPVAVDRARGWMLMSDAGGRLRELVAQERSLDPWLEVLQLYAGLQLDMVGSATDLIAVGTPDLRREQLAFRYEALLDEIAGLPEVPPELLARARASVAEVRAMGDDLAELGIPDTIQHDDLNDGQIYVRDGRYLLLDWGDACVSHPFFTLSVALEGQIAWGVDDEENSVDIGPFRDAYLAPFADALGRSLDDLRRASTIATRLGWACRAANGHVAGTDATPTVRRLQMFLDGHV